MMKSRILEEVLSELSLVLHVAPISGRGIRFMTEACMF
jgi:hypothetical protein